VSFKIISYFFFFPIAFLSPLPSVELPLFLDDSLNLIPSFVCDASFPLMFLPCFLAFLRAALASTRFLTCSGL